MPESPIRILVVCTGNQHRSPIAHAILSTIVVRRGLNAQIASAGLLPGGMPMPTETWDALVALGYEGPSLESFRSRQVTSPMVRGADLLLAMAREHVRELTVRVPEVWGRTFTLKELVRRGTAIGPRNGGPMSEWLASAGEGRNRGELLGFSSSDDVVDPAGGPPSGFTKTAEEIRALCVSLADLVWPQA
jgi:low molecular weight protein-tyrosine phosphatase